MCRLYIFTSKLRARNPSRIQKLDFGITMGFQSNIKQLSFYDSALSLIDEKGENNSKLGDIYSFKFLF
jgi:hypothetical protein